MVALREYEDGNVVDIFDNEVYEVYKSFLSMHAKNSLATEINYDSRIREFFLLILNKKVEFLTADEIRGIKKRVVQVKYIDKLVSRGNSFNTIDTKLNSVASFYGELMANDIMVNPKVLKATLPKDVTHHYSMTREELDLLLDYCKREKRMADVKHLYIKTLFVTAGRKTATLGLKWSDFTKEKDVGTGIMVNVMVVRNNKGKKIREIAISDEFHDELQLINDGEEKVFNISAKTIERMLQGFSEEIGKHITPHVLKTTALNLGYELTRDLNLCKQHGDHAQMSTLEIYIKPERSLVNQLSYRTSKPMDFSKIYELSNEELNKLIEQNDDLKMLILSKIVEPC